MSDEEGPPCTSSPSSSGAEEERMHVHVYKEAMLLQQQQEEEELEAEESSDDLLASTNALLASVGIHAAPLVALSELQTSASSMCVAIFEALFNIRLREIIRKPVLPEHSVHNAQVIITKLRASPMSRKLPLSTEVTGENVMAGDLGAIEELVHVFTAMVDLYNGRFDGGLSSSGDASQQQQEEETGEEGNGGHQPRKQKGMKKSGRGARKAHTAVSLLADSSSSTGNREGATRPSRSMKRRMVKPDTIAPPVVVMTSSKARGPAGSAQKRTTQRSSSAGSLLQQRQAVNRNRPQTAIPSSRARAGGPRTAVRRPSSSSSTSSSRYARGQGDDEGSSGFTIGSMTPEGDFIARQMMGQNHTTMWRQFFNRYLTKSEKQDFLKGRQWQDMAGKSENLQKYYQQALADYEREERMRIRNEARQAKYRNQSLLHREKVERIKALRLAEQIQAQKVSDRMKRETLSENRMKHLLKHLVKQMNEWRREDAKYQVKQIKELYRYGSSQAEAVEHTYRQRIAMLEELRKARTLENHFVYKAQEEMLSDMIHELRRMQDERVQQAMNKDQQFREAALRKSDELFHTLFEAMNVEDWEGVRRDRFMTASASAIDELTDASVPSPSERRQASRANRHFRHKAVNRGGVHVATSSYAASASAGSDSSTIKMSRAQDNAAAAVPSPASSGGSSSGEAKAGGSTSTAAITKRIEKENWVVG